MMQFCTNNIDFSAHLCSSIIGTVITVQMKGLVEFHLTHFLTQTKF